MSGTNRAHQRDKIVNNTAQVVARRILCGQRGGMNEAPALLALDRIEEALARIEAAARPAQTDGDADLRRRHDDLKTCVARSLAELDELLAQRDRG
jgi:hypothetical protein